MTLDLTELNPAQRDAVLTTEGPLLVLAGAGSGKTRVLTYRIAHMVGDLGVAPDDILAITFTNKAAAEMRSRLEDVIGAKARYMWVSTFHAMCVRMLRRDAERLGYSRDFTIYDADDAKRVVSAVLNDMGKDLKRFPPPMVASRISSAKNELIGPERFAAENGDFISQVVAEAYAAYQERLRRANAMDFDDLLVRAHELLAGEEDVLRRYQDRFRYIHVDEYQDTNHAQYRIVNLLASASHNLMVVGDDDQSIYSWRGADIRNILEFERDYPNATVIKLEQNYRSTKTILAAANAVVENNRGRKPKTLWTANVEGESITRYTASDERDEARFVVGEIERLRNDEGRSLTEFAVFYRTNAQSRVLEDAFVRSGVPYRIVGGTRFFERAEIRDVLAYLRSIVNPADEVSLRRIVNTPKRGIGDATVDKVVALANQRGITLLDAFGAAVDEGLLGTGPAGKVATFLALYTKLREIGGFSLRDTVTDVVSASGLIEALKSERSEEALGRIENIEEFYGVVGEFDATHEKMTLADLMEWIALRTDLDALPEGERFVTLMTVHTAKGLEFPVVFIAGLEDAIFPHSSSIADIAEMEEERRLAYVAITRARERLYMSHALRRSLYGREQHNLPSRFMDEVPEEFMKSTGVGSAGYRGEGYLGGAGRRSASGSRGAAFSPSETTRFGGGFGGGGASYSGGAPAPSGRVFGSGQPRKEPTTDVVHLEVGDMVEHKVFGRGKVKEVEGDKVTISFAAPTGTKKVLLGYAPIRKLAE
jgi:DNA helicase-2/ATP-dependent DNA helicase PcrA